MNKRDKLNIEDEQFVLSLRRKQWDALCEKYEKRGEMNTDECYFSEVNYKMFIKPSLKAKLKERKNKTWKSKKTTSNQNTEATDVSHKATEAEEIAESENTVSSTNEFIDVDVSMFIDEDSNVTLCDSNYHSLKNNFNFSENEFDSGVEMSDKGEQYYETSIHLNSFIDDNEDDATLTEMGNLRDHSNCSEINSTVDDHLHTLICFIEKELKSNLKVMLENRIVSKLLDFDQYSYWHKCTKEEMARLKKYISINDLRDYMKYCYSADIPKNANVSLIGDVIAYKMKSNIRKLFTKRELFRHDKNKYLKYRKKIILEWQKLCEEIPLGCLVLYGTYILYSIEKLKDRKI